MHKPNDIASKLMGVPFETLDERAQKVTRHVAARTHITRGPAGSEQPAPTGGQRAADAVASFGGSWVFVGLFTATMLCWVALNATLLARQGSTFDPYPYILLNLFLSMLAAIQAPIILMAQNRQAQKDRIASEHDYEVNLKAELEIMLLHHKVDAMREAQWHGLLKIQQGQMRRLKRLIEQRAAAPG